jgi:methyl-accepting chemotaxis protein
VSLFNSVAKRMFWGMAALVFLVFWLAFVAVGTIRTLDRSVDEELGLVLQTSTMSTGLVGSVTTEIRAAEEYLDRPAPRVKAEFVRNGDSAYAIQRRYRDLPSLTTSDRYILNRIGATQARIEVVYAHSHALVDLGRREDAHAIAVQARPAADTLIADVNSLTLAQTTRSMARASELKDQAQRRSRLLWLGFFASVAIGVVVAYTTWHSVNLPLLRLTGAADRFGAGDLRPVRLGGMPDELARLARAMDDMGAKLRSVLQAVTAEAAQISGSASDFSAMSEELASSSGEISTAMVRMANSATHQMSGMKEADELLHALRRTAEENARAAARVVALGERIRELAGHHRANVTAASASLLDVREVVQTSASQAQQLAQLSESITDFIDLIKQISSQTNLLALNAAIEAARAGEHGRGFAVVAEEVRRLADSSAAAAENVTKTVELIRARVREVAQTMELGSAKVGGIEGVAAGAARGLEEISAAIHDVTAAAAAVEREATENRRIVDEVGKMTAGASQTASDHAAMSEEVTAAAEQQSASTEQIASSAADLLEGAQRLTGLMADFKT